jgi:hypothetical protein
VCVRPPAPLISLSNYDLSISLALQLFLSPGLYWIGWPKKNLARTAKGGLEWNPSPISKQESLQKAGVLLAGQPGTTLTLTPMHQITMDLACHSVPLNPS